MLHKILFIFPSFRFGGAERVLEVILNHIDRTQFEPVIVVLEPTVYHRIDIPRDIRIVYLNRTSERKKLSVILALSKTIRTESPVLLCSFLYFVNYWTVAARFLSGKKVPIVFTEHTDLSNLQKIESVRMMGLRRTLSKYLLYPAARTIICVSRGIREDLVRNFGARPERCRVIYNPVDIDYVEHKSAEDPSHPWFGESIPIIIASGRLTRQKNYPLLFRSVARINRTMPIRLMVLGEGELKETLIDEVGRLELKDKIAFLGFQDNPFKYISRARVFVLSSSYEGFGNVLIEAMALGIPVVSTRCPSGPEEIIQDGINGILVPPDDEQALAESIRTLLVREDLRSRIAKAGRERAEDFRARKIACEYEDVFREVGAVPESEGGLA